MRQVYKSVHNKSLYSTLRSETGGSFGYLCTCLILKSDELDAYCIHAAVAGLGTDENALIESVASNDVEDLRAASLSYFKAFKNDMLQDIMDDTSGRFRALLKELCKAERLRQDFSDEKLVYFSIKLFQAKSYSVSSFRQHFLSLLPIMSHTSIKRLSELFPTINSGVSLVPYIKKKMGGSFAKLLVAICESAIDIVGYFTTLLGEAIHAKDEKTVSRIIFRRCDIDLVSIMERYLLVNQRRLIDDINGNFSDEISIGLLRFLKSS